MEEDIEIIQNIIFNKNGDQMNYIDINNGTHDNECETFITAIEHLIKGYKQLEEENKRLIKANDNLKSTKRIKTYKEVEKYFIPKSKVKEKIEEIKLSFKDDCLALHEFQRLAKIDVLQELLREE